MKRFGYALACLAVTTAPGLAQEATPEPELLSAFFGLNDSRQIRVRTLPLCRGQSRGVPGNDGMPVIFSHEVDPDTLDPEDFQITTESGQVFAADCVTLRPANEEGELRTALVIGEYGSQTDQPLRVEIVGDIRSLGGELSFLGASTDVIALEDGPTLILGEIVPDSQWRLGGEGDCPSEGTQTVVRAVWVGGITKPGGAEIDESEMALYRVRIQQGDGTLLTVTPLAVGDLNDNDNNHELCLGDTGTPVSIFFPAGHLTDPNEDLNPATEIAVSGAAPH